MHEATTKPPNREMIKNLSFHVQANNPRYLESPLVMDDVNFVGMAVKTMIGTAKVDSCRISFPANVDLAA